MLGLGLGLGLGLVGVHDPDPLFLFGHRVEHTHGMLVCRYGGIRYFYFRAIDLCRLTLKINPKD